MDLVTPIWLFNLIIISAIIILLIATALVLSKKNISTLMRFSLLILTWSLPVLGGISAILILVVPPKNN